MHKEKLLLNCTIKLKNVIYRKVMLIEKTLSTRQSNPGAVQFNSEQHTFNFQRHQNEPHFSSLQFN